jgi:hypothetical protein
MFFIDFGLYVICVSDECPDVASTSQSLAREARFFALHIAACGVQIVLEPF